MELTITGEFAERILATSKKDSRLAQALAERYLEAVDATAMARFLLTRAVAASLLAERLKKDPAGTIRLLQRLPAASGARRAPLRKVAVSVAAPKPAKRKRQRLGEGESDRVKNQVRAFLAKHPWATRKDLQRAAHLPTQAIYRRIMGELQRSGEVVSKGRKATVAYALKGAAAKRPGAKPAPAKVAKGRKRAAKPAVRKPAAKAARKPAGAASKG